MVLAGEAPMFHRRARDKRVRRGEDGRMIALAHGQQDACSRIPSGKPIPLLTGLDADHVVADKAYDSHAILDHIEASGARPIP